ncbi:MAG TPA: hypothetical protein VII23_04800 [Terriglobales bacterium]
MEIALHKICDFINGGPWSDREYAGSGIRVVKVTNMEDGTIVLRNDDDYLPASKYDKYKKHELKTDDVVVATVGSQPTRPRTIDEMLHDVRALLKRTVDMTVAAKYLRRYTDVPALIYLLKERAISMLDPQSWDDSNDSYYLTLYRERKNLKSVLALCFTRADETYHHWRVFAGGPSGVCIRFNRSALLNAVRKQPDLRTGDVSYLTLAGIRNRQLSIEELPFLKRYAFEHESEFRVIYESNARRESQLDIPVPLSCIDKVTLSPWVHPNLSSHLKRVLRDIDGCKALQIVRSTLIGNAEWKSFGEDAD